MTQTVRDVMTAHPLAISATASVLEAARLMREHGIGDVIVLEGERLIGILTDRDIVVRALAAGREPGLTPAGAVCSRQLTTVSPADSVGDALRLMRRRAVRRLPVVEANGRVIGIVAIGDVAVENDRRSALADISVAPPNV